MRLPYQLPVLPTISSNLGIISKIVSKKAIHKWLNAIHLYYCTWLNEMEKHKEEKDTRESKSPFVEPFDFILFYCLLLFTFV
jgi:hypothetical protein